MLLLLLRGNATDLTTNSVFVFDTVNTTESATVLTTLRASVFDAVAIAEQQRYQIYRYQFLMQLQLLNLH